MSFQEKYREYKERQEAKKYFRNNNDQFLKADDWLKVILWGIVTALASGVILGLFISFVHINSSIFYIIVGAVVANALTRVSGIESQQIAIMSVIFTFLAFLVMELSMYISLYQMAGAMINFTMILDMIPRAFMQLFAGNIFTTLCVILGLAVSYQQAK